MLYFPKWLVALILAACLAGVALTIPNLFPQQVVKRWPSFLPKSRSASASTCAAAPTCSMRSICARSSRERLNNAVDGLRDAFRGARIGYTGLGVEGDHISFTLREPDRIEDVRSIVKKADSDLDLTTSPAGTVTLKFSRRRANRIEQQIVDQSIEIVRRRIDETGTKEPTIQREGADRIVLELPGVENPEFVKRPRQDREDDLPAGRRERGARSTRAICRPATRLLPLKDGHSPPGRDRSSCRSACW